MKKSKTIKMFKKNNNFKIKIFKINKFYHNFCKIKKNKLILKIISKIIIIF